MESRVCEGRRTGVIVTSFHFYKGRIDYISLHCYLFKFHSAILLLSLYCTSAFMLQINNSLLFSHIWEMLADILLSLNSLACACPIIQRHLELYTMQCQIIRWI